jgi:hypothetical protein
MSQELLAIIEQIEREKGIKKEIMLEAVESAMLSAAKRVIDLKPDEEFKSGNYSENARGGKGCSFYGIPKSRRRDCQRHGLSF